MGGKKISHREFWLNLVRNLLVQVGQNGMCLGPIGKPPAEATRVVRLEEHGRKHWTIRSAMRRRCHVCSARGVNRKVSVKRQRCDVALCWIENAF